MRLHRPPPSKSDMDELARQIAAYRAALVAQGISDPLADRLTEQFRQQLLGLAFDLVGRGVETK